MKRRRSRSRSSPFRRRGAVIVFAVVAITVASSMIAILLRTASLSHRQFKREEYRVQAGLLADAGVTRAIQALKSNPNFSSDIWNIPAEQLASNRSAVVRYSVTSNSKQPELRIISVVAEYPAEHPDVVKISRELRIPESQ